MPVEHFDVCVAGATGWAGSELARGIAHADDLRLVAAVSRTHAGRTLGDVLGEPRLACPVHATAAEALATACDVFVEYTKPDVARSNIVAALESGVHVVVGTSGLADDDFADIDVMARRQNRAVLACGNFALTVVLLQKFAETAARLIPQWEIVDYASDSKVDAPSGTARELASRRGYQVLVSVGLVSYGLLHLVVAWIAVQIAFGRKGDASNQGALAQLTKQPLGAIPLWVMERCALPRRQVSFTVATL